MSVAWLPRGWDQVWAVAPGQEALELQNLPPRSTPVQPCGVSVISMPRGSWGVGEKGEVNSCAWFPSVTGADLPSSLG